MCIPSSVQEVPVAENKYAQMKNDPYLEANSVWIVMRQRRFASFAHLVHHVISDLVFMNVPLVICSNLMYRNRR